MLLTLALLPAVVRADVPKIVEVASDKLSIKTKSANVDWAFTLQNDGKDRATVCLDMSPLVTPDGRSLAFTLADAAGNAIKNPITIGRLARISLRLQANLKRGNYGAPTGPYRGTIGIIMDDKRTTVPVEINFERAALGVKVNPVTQSTAEVTQDSTSLNLHLHETEGIARTLPAPTILFLDRKITTGAVAAKYDVENSKPAKTEFKIGADGDVNIQFPINGVANPGKYEGKIRFSAPDRLPVDVSFTFSARYAIWIPIVLISLGVIVASVLRFILGVWRPRLTVQRDAIVLRDRLIAFRDSTLVDEGGLSPEEIAVVTKLLGQVGQVMTGSGNEAQQALLVTIGEKAQLLGPWVRANRLADGEGVDDEMRSSLRSVTASLSGDTAWDFAAQQTALGEVSDKMRKAIGTAIKTAIAALLARADLPPVEQDRLAQAQAAIEADEFRTAQALLDEARREVAKHILAILRAQIDHGSAPPHNLSAADWRVFVNLEKPKLDRAETMDEGAMLATIIEIQTSYLGKMIAAFSAEMTGAQNPAVTVPLAAAAAEYANKRFEEARVNYEVALEAQTATTGQGRGRVPSLPSALSLAVGATAGLATSEKWTDQFVPSVLPLSDNLETVQRSLLIIELVTSVVIGLIAVVIGLAFLYINDDDWGSIGDMVAAFVWGLGLNQFAGTQFQSITDLRKQFVDA